MNRLQAKQISRSANKTGGSSPSTTSAQDDIEQLEAALLAKQRFIAATLNLSWRLAVTVLVPLIGGIQLDKRFDSSPSYTITGFMLAVVLGCVAVWHTVQEVNEIQAEDSKGKKK